MSANPSERIDRVCRPIGWSGSVVVSLSALVLPENQKTVQGWFDKLEYGCRYTAWRLIYQNDYNHAVGQGQQASQLRDIATGEDVKPAVPASASAASETAPASAGAAK
ncbi:hypothetical protein F6X40_10565 [Paraburkholderia sp. UCT31]|uniref:hypothetical protein n=1 Tax=Paraburkholderia sp. UCT31 TaxID=2615209 RepID=UPI00165652AD|nr:hypothetical protein [Paraburkholderia sp. UCT31]MBC8737250.1 hypothetical protein [Paraburkholderia sp. UCT31]